MGIRNTERTGAGMRREEATPAATRALSFARYAFAATRVQSMNQLSSHVLPPSRDTP